MDRLQINQNFSYALVCLFALLMRLGATVNKAREGGNSTYRLTFWKVFYQAAASFGMGFLCANILADLKWGNGWKMGLLFLISFSSTVLVDALLLISPRMVLKELLTLASANLARLGNSTPPAGTNNLSPPSTEEDENELPTPPADN